MHLKKLNNIFIISFSILVGVLICEIIARTLGLGNPLIYKNDVLVGYRLRANQSKKRFANANITTDYEGFRIDPNQIKDSDSEIIIFVGDSVTYGGSFIDNPELFSSIYCKNSIEFTCLNAGVNAWGTYNMGRFISNFSTYSERIPSKFILVILPGDDLRNLSLLSSLPYWSAPPKNPKAINELINYFLWKYRVPILRKKFVKNQKDLLKESEIKTKTINQSWKDLDKYIESSNSKVEVIITPPKRWFKKSKESKKEVNLYDSLLSTIASNPKVTKTCNLYYPIKDVYSSDDYVDSVHLSKSGHKKWAKYISLCLSE